MSITDHAVRIHHTDERHTSQLEKIHFLPITRRHLMIRIRQANKRKFFFAPIFAELIISIGTDRKNLRAAACELFILITQARQLRAAIWSHEAAQERQHYRLAAIIGKTNQFFIYILKFELNRRFARIQQISHLKLTFWLSSKSHRTFSRSICRSMCFAGLDDKNTAAKFRLSMDITRREQI